MASGWWKSTHTNLALGSPVDFTVTTSPFAPRGYPKLGSIATGAGHYLGGVPFTTINDVIYYAGDDYVQDTDKPVLCRYDGRVATEVLEIPYISGTTPAKAILSMVKDSSGNIYISTWDSGTTSTTFAGRVFKFNPTAGTISTFGDNVFSAGQLPYSLAVLGGSLWVGTARTDPTLHAHIYYINLTTAVTTLYQTLASGAIAAPTISSVVRNGTGTNSYKLTTVNAGGGESGATTVSVTNDNVLDATTLNTITWSNPSDTDIASYKLYRTAGHTSTGVVNSPTSATVSFVDTGSAGNGAAAPAAPTTSAPTSMAGSSLLAGGGTAYRYRATATSGGNESYACAAVDLGNGPNSQGPGSDNVNLVVNFPAADGATTFKIYRMQGPGTAGMILSTVPSVGATSWNTFDNTANGNGTYPKISPPAIGVVATDPLTTTTYTVTANTANGETTASSTSSTNAKATLTASRKVTVTWGAVGGASSYNVYRTVGHTSTGKIVNATASTSAEDTGLAGSGTSPTINTTGDPYGGVGCLTNFGDDLYVGMFQEAGAFATVRKIDEVFAFSLSDTVAPGGTAQSYNGFTAGIEFEGNLYMAYWNDDATDITLIRKYTGSAWSTVATISGAGARPIVAFAAANGVCYAYGGGDAKTGILYSSPDGTTWTDVTSLLPTAREAIPFMANTNVLGGF